MTERRLAGLLATAMLVVGALAWSFAMRPALDVDPTPLEALPLDLGSWHGSEIPMEQTVESLLRADFNIQRTYVHPTGERVWLYVGYYGTERGGHPEHTPRFCYVAHGWRILSDRTVEVDAQRGLRAVELVVEQAGQQRLVQFWYQSFRRPGLLGPISVTLDHLLGNLWDGRADGALVRFSTRIPSGEIEIARSRLRSFATRFEPQLERHWPLEQPRS